MLTPRECARLQGFPETFKLHPTRSAAYKQFENAVPVPLVKIVAEAMLSKVPQIDARKAANQSTHSMAAQ